MGKRTPQGNASTDVRPKKRARGGIVIPSVAEIGTLSAGGTVKKPPALTDESIHVGLYPYITDGSTYSDIFSSKRLWVAQFMTALRPDPTFKVRRMMELMAEADDTGNDPPPRTMDELSLRYRSMYQFVWSKTPDPDGIGWAKGRSGFYIDEDYVKEFFMYFDDLMAWRKDYQDDEFEKIIGKIKIVIHMLDSSTLDLKFDIDEDELKCEIEVVKEKSAMMSVFDLPPPHFPPRIVVLTFELVNPDKVHLIFSGNTKPFQANFVKRNIKGTSLKAKPEDTYGEYLRVLEHLDIKDEAKAVATLKDLLDKCLLESPVSLRCQDTKLDRENLEQVVAHFTNVANVRIDM